jgi:D-arabinose 1-dehydrogenase-like Zn-dependent alcohol dehydrogenase
MAARSTIFPLTVSFDASPIKLLSIVVEGINVQGSAAASRSAMRRMLQFSADHQIKATIMKWPMSVAGIEEGMKTLRDGKMKYRGVLVAA